MFYLEGVTKELIMLRCRCGKFTNYGITCTSCRTQNSIIQNSYDDDEEETSEEEEEPTESLEALEEASENTED